MKLPSESAVREACDLNARMLPRHSTPGKRMPLEQIIAEVDSAARRPLEESVTLPAAAYTNPEFFDWEMENVFRAEWLCVAHVSQIPSPGDFLNIDLLGEPLIVVHGKDDDIRVLSRICPHRAMDIMPPGFGYDDRSHAVRRAESQGQLPGCGHTRLFLCPYHSWTFELDGGLKACPEMHRAANFQRTDWALKSFATEVWHGFVFVNLDGAAESPVSHRLANVYGYLGKWKPEDMVVAVHREWDCPFNWKVLVENFMESYHHAGAHKNSLQLLMPATDTWTEREQPHYVRCHLPYREKVRMEIRETESAGGQWDAFPAIPGLNETERFEWGLVLGHPNFLIATAPDSLVCYRQQPLGPDRHLLTTTLLVPRSVAEHPRYSEWLEAGESAAVGFHLEDMECCTAVQRGFYASGWQQGRLSHLEMPIWLIQRYLAARSRGVWPTNDMPAANAQH
jgi:phenylpropionate dioxygenase-like ring-hydroxylating dioxygenase large terminal subunit